MKKRQFGFVKSAWRGSIVARDGVNEAAFESHGGLSGAVDIMPKNEAMIALVALYGRAFLFLVWWDCASRIISGVTLLGRL